MSGDWGVVAIATATVINTFFSDRSAIETRIHCTTSGDWFILIESIL